MSKHLNILWKGIEYQSLENCILKITETGWEAVSIIIGKYNDVVYRVEYKLKTNHNSETTFLEIRSRLSDITSVDLIVSDSIGNWTMNGIKAEQFRGCTDVDISLTPFTNSLPINRLKLKNDEQGEIRALFVDVLEKQIRPVEQRYTRLSKSEYKFENVPNDFEKVINVDERGLVLNYPELFVRIDLKEKRDE